MIFLFAALLTFTIGYLLSIKKITFFLKGYYFMLAKRKKQYNQALLLKYSARLIIWFPPCFY